MPGLLALRASIISPSCSEDPRVCTIFDTWRPDSEPCQVANCSACTLEHPSCGTYNAATQTTTCLWRYVECKNGRVSKVALGEVCWLACMGACVQVLQT
jgi:hypothetical protein